MQNTTALANVLRKGTNPSADFAVKPKDASPVAEVESVPDFAELPFDDVKTVAREYLTQTDWPKAKVAAFDAFLRESTACQDYLASIVETEAHRDD